jgi:hypothetical protein
MGDVSTRSHNPASLKKPHTQNSPTNSTKHTHTHTHTPTHREIVARPDRAVALAAGKERAREHERPIGATRTHQLTLGGGHVLVETIPVEGGGGTVMDRDGCTIDRRLVEIERK